MNRKTLLFILIGLLIVIAGLTFFFFRRNVNNNPENGSSGIILFYGTGCPHCAVVDAYIKDNKVEEKVSFEKKEVFFNKNNTQLLAEKAAACGVPADNIGVPFLWDSSNSKCYIGETDIINFFKAKIGG